jgi:hypothetical protein
MCQGEKPPLIHHQGISPAFAETGSAALPSLAPRWVTRVS